MELPAQRITELTPTNRPVVHMLFWAAVFLIAISQHGYFGFDNKPVTLTVLHDLIILLPQVIAAYFLAYLIVPIFFLKKKYLLFTVYLVAGSYFICAIARYLTIKVAEPLIGIPAKEEENLGEILSNVRKLFFVYFFSNFSVAFVFLAVKTLMDQYALRQHNLMLAKEKSTADLQYLKAQLNPHFLFNTLNNIYSLSISKHPATSPSIARMSDILDHIIYKSQALEVPLADEIKLLENYIELEKLRYDDRLEVVFKKEIKKEMMIAPLMLLCLVENAFKHGGSQTMGETNIEIDLKTGPNGFTFAIINPRSSTAPTGSGGSSGVGLKNLRKQLELLYPKRHELEVTESMRLFTVKLSILSPGLQTSGMRQKPKL